MGETESDNTLTAQKRTGSNDTVHLYDGTFVEQARTWRCNETWKVYPPLCSGKRAQPSKNDEEPEFDLTLSEVMTEDYLIRDGEIVGKICGNCATIARKIDTGGGQ